MLFDFFGTLVEYQPDRSRLRSPRAAQLARSMGFAGGHDVFVRIWDHASSELERAASRTRREFSMADAAAAFGAAAGIALTAEQSQRLGQAFVTEWSQHLRPVPGAADLVQRLARRCRVAVVSNTHDVDMVPRLLSEMGVGGDVAAVVLSVEHGWQKPHASIYLAALDELDCRPGDAVFVGDNVEADYLGPRRAGMTAYLIDPDGRSTVPSAHRLTSVVDLAQAMGLEPEQGSNRSSGTGV